MTALRWNAIATEGTDNRSIDWTKRLPSGSTLSSVAYSTDPDSNNLTFSSNSVASNVSTITITTDKTEGDFWIKITPTLDVGSISPISVKLRVVKHKDTR